MLMRSYLSSLGHLISVGDDDDSAAVVHCSLRFTEFKENMGNEATQSAKKNEKKRKKILSLAQVREQNANKVVVTTNINENQIQQALLRNANWFIMEAIAKEQERVRKGKMHRIEEAGNEAIAPHAYPMNNVNNHWNTLENAGENSDDCGVAPSETLGIDETSNTATRLRNRSFEIGESSRGPIDIVNVPPKEPFMDEHFFNDDNMDLDFEFNVNPLIHESLHYLGNMDIEWPSCHALHWLDEKLTNSLRYRPLFGTCCKQGKIRLPILQPLPPAIQVLYDDDSSHAKSFRSHIREYNAANAFTSLEVKLDDQILNGRGPKPFSIYGELKH
ncbi:hypothetical protein GIB67_022649 [Kingdonia uniflora]|uniref:Uncharacterized protein n=1 Tax=Kingdonia uniflora TaxID=39325 RepID=A0A7J7P896_9MAGN|nr:hypothetical protein GIB67_022649 [Kingdonia uniflora]